DLFPVCAHAQGETEASRKEITKSKQNRTEKGRSRTYTSRVWRWKINTGNAGKGKRMGEHSYRLFHSFHQLILAHYVLHHQIEHCYREGIVPFDAEGLQRKTGVRA